jgi:hypothetical protein
MCATWPWEELITGQCRGIIHLEQDIASPTGSVIFEVTNTGFDAALKPPENAALCQRDGPGEGSVAALSTARSISSTVMSGVMLTRTTPVELPTSDIAVADAASG